MFTVYESPLCQLVYIHQCTNLPHVLVYEFVYCIRVSTYTSLRLYKSPLIRVSAYTSLLSTTLGTGCLRLTTTSRQGASKVSRIRKSSEPVWNRFHRKNSAPFAPPSNDKKTNANFWYGLIWSLVFYYYHFYFYVVYNWSIFVSLQTVIKEKQAQIYNYHTFLKILCTSCKIKKINLLGIPFLPMAPYPKENLRQTPNGPWP